MDSHAIANYHGCQPLLSDLTQHIKILMLRLEK